jgi:hypothetical protein
MFAFEYALVPYINPDVGSTDFSRTSKVGAGGSEPPEPPEPPDSPDPPDPPDPPEPAKVLEPPTTVDYE